MSEFISRNILEKQIASWIGGLYAEIDTLKARIAELEAEAGNPDKTDGPDWDTAPVWANWWAVDADGDAWYHLKKPEINGDGFEWGSGDISMLCFHKNIKQFWENSITKRPAKAKKP